MKWIFLMLLSNSIYAAEKTFTDSIQGMSWDGDQFTYNLQTYQKPLKVDGNGRWVPCMENARKAEMAVLLTVDEKDSSIKDCKLYSGDFKVIQ